MRARGLHGRIERLKVRVPSCACAALRAWCGHPVDLVDRASRSASWTPSRTSHVACLFVKVAETFRPRVRALRRDILAAPEGYCSISRMLNALDTLGAVVRAAVRRPSPDGSLGIIRVICGPTLEDGPLLRLIHTLTGVMSSKDRMPPVVKASALSALALLACASPHIHQNVCVDYLCASSSVVYRALVDILREPSLSRTVGADAVVLLVILCAYQRGERRNPFVQRLRGAGYEGVHGRPYHADVITEPESPPSHPSRSPSLAFVSRTGSVDIFFLNLVLSDAAVEVCGVRVIQSGSGDEFKSHVHTPHEDSRPPTPSVASSAPPHTLFAASLAKPLHTLAAAVNANICAGSCPNCLRIGR